MRRLIRYTSLAGGCAIGVYLLLWFVGALFFINAYRVHSGMTLAEAIQIVGPPDSMKLTEHGKGSQRGPVVGVDVDDYFVWKRGHTWLILAVKDGVIIYKDFYNTVF